MIAKKLTIAAALLCLLTACREDSGGHHGYVEGEFLRIGPDEPGRLTALHTRQGETVEPGAPLFTLESDVIAAEKAAADARVLEARASLDNLMAEQQRPEEIEVRLAAKRSAQADLELARGELRRVRKLFKDGIVAKARLDTAQAAFDKATANLAQIEQEIETARLSARIQVIEQAEAALQGAEAARDAAGVRLARRSLNAPAAAYVQEVFFRPGEMVPAGQAVMSLLPPENRKIVFFVEEPARAAFAPGTALNVTCDGCPDGLTAEVDWISAREEFTPPVIFSPDERAKLIYRLEAGPAQPLSLSPGQPVTVTLPGNGAAQ